MRELKIYFKYLRMNLLSGLQYKGWWIMILQVMLVVISDPISLILMFSRFGSIGVWSVERIVLIYAIAVTSFGLAESFFRGFDYFPTQMIRSGSFDRVLLRPLPLFTQIAGSYFHIHRLSRVFSGSLAIAWCLCKLKVKINIIKIIILLLAILGGFISYAGVFIFTSGLAFFTIQGLDWIYIFTNASYQVTRVPMDYMPKILRNIFTFFLPILVISYYPASVICNWGEKTITGFLALPSGILFFIFSTLVWNFGVKHYKSTGS